MRAFSNGCTAMTGVEAVSNGVPMFREPTVKQARRCLELIVGILIVLLLGVGFLSTAYRVNATQPGHAGYQSILSQLAGAVLGRGPLYGITIGSVISVLILSANTSFAGFPSLCRTLAADGFLPEAFVHRGRRLAFSHGIYVLGGAAGMLLVAFGGITDALIPLFAVGAFTAFTLSQWGMVVHWRRRPGVRRKLVMNGVGAVCTGVTCVIVGVSKFTEGAWISILLILMVGAFLWAVHRHRDFVDNVTKVDEALPVCPQRPALGVVPLRRWDAVSVKAMGFAMGFAREVVAVQVVTEDYGVDDLQGRWASLVEEPARRHGLAIPKLVVLRSEYRHVYQPLVEHVTSLAREQPDRHIAVIVPELVDRRWYHFFFGVPRASVLRSLLLFRGGPQIILIEAPWYLREWRPEQEQLLEMPNGPDGIDGFAGLDGFGGRVAGGLLDPARRFAMSTSKTTTDHDEIRRWAEARGGKPAGVRGTGDGNPGMLRIEFDHGSEKLEAIAWDDWFAAFDANGLAFVYQDEVDGATSRFNKIISRDTVERRQRGESHASVHRPHGR
jgi:hypothetical protein